MSIEATARPRSVPAWKPAKTASGSRFSNQSRAGPSPTTSTLWRTCRRASRSIVSEKTSRPFSITSRPTKPITGSSSAMPSDAPPGQVAPPGIEDLAVDAARPDADVVVHPLVAQQLRHRIRRREDRVAAAVEAAQDRQQHRLEEGHAVIARIGLEAGVDRGDHRQVPSARQRHRAVAGNVGAGDVEDVGPEGLEVPARPRRERHAELIFGAARDRQRRDARRDRPWAGRPASSSVGE